MVNETPDWVDLEMQDGWVVDESLPAKERPDIDWEFINWLVRPQYEYDRASQVVVFVEASEHEPDKVVSLQPSAKVLFNESQMAVTRRWNAAINNNGLVGTPD